MRHDSPNAPAFNTAPPLLSGRAEICVLLLGLAVVLGRVVGVLAVAGEPHAPFDLRAVAVPRVLELQPGQIAYEPSASTGSAVWVAEWLTAESLRGPGPGGKTVPRPGHFVVDANLPPGLRARDGDYAQSGFDRGHLPAAANWGHARAVTFNLGVVAPQLPSVNRGPMKWLEGQLRAQVDERTSLLVVTAPVYQLGAAPRFAGRLPVPSAFVKAVLVYVDGQPAAGQAYRIGNHATAEVELLSIDQVEELLQRDLFSFLPDDVEARIEAGL